MANLIAITICPDREFSFEQLSCIYSRQVPVETPLILEGQYIRLEPLTLDYLDPLTAIGLDPELWRWTTTRMCSREDLRAYIETALEWQRQGSALPFATTEKKSGEVIGSTRFANIDKTNRRMEIGWTWLAPKWQRTAANTEAKYLMLKHAFEVQGCIRVEFKTNVKNEKSRAALVRLGAKEEGIFRNHYIMPDGSLRDSVYYSILDREWPEVKAVLEKKLVA